jgi:sterol desaturase/sphingolipid hydroxylase (fatty acid hydroxylase superfamily)
MAVAVDMDTVSHHSGFYVLFRTSRNPWYRDIINLAIAYIIAEAGFFWGLHTIHHSSEYYNLSTALRQAAIQDIGLAIYDILQALFIPPQIFLVHRYFSEIFQFWLHTSVLL